MAIFSACVTGSSQFVHNTNVGWVISHESTQYCMQVLENEQAKEMARKEKARLRLLEQQRKEQVEQMHAKLNSDAAAGEVCEWCRVTR